VPLRTVHYVRCDSALGDRSEAVRPAILRDIPDRKHDRRGTLDFSYSAQVFEVTHRAGDEGRPRDDGVSQQQGL
jgi:hypothetical protein